MILLPIGHEQDSTRRLPWVTFGVMIACAVAFVWTGFGGSRTEWEALGAQKRAIDFWMERPYLSLDPGVDQAMHGMSTGEKREAFREGLRTAAGQPPEEAALAAEQQELDRLCAEALAGPAKDVFGRWGLVPADFSAVTLFSHMFLHAGWLHLLGNLFILYLTGPFVEDVWGRPVYASFYLVSGAVAGLTFAIPHSQLAEPLVGASGAIAGVMGAFAVRYGSTRIQFFYALALGGVRGTFWAPAWLVLGLWFGQQLLMTTLASTGAGGGGVAYLAHAGGFAFGVVVAMGFRKLEIEQRWLAPGIEAATNRVVVHNAEVDAALSLAAEGRAEEAWGHLSAEVRKSPAHADAVLALWSLATSCGRADEAAPGLARLIEEELRRGEVDLPLDHWAELRQAVPAFPLDAPLLVRLATTLARRGRPREALDALRRALLGAGKACDASLAIKIAETAVGLDPQVARVAARLALDRPDIDPAGRGKAEALLARIARSTVAAKS